MHVTNKQLGDLVVALMVAAEEGALRNEGLARTLEAECRVRGIDIVELPYGHGTTTPERWLESYLQL
jgi:hypothetical protein